MKSNQSCRASLSGAFPFCESVARPAMAFPTVSGRVFSGVFMTMDTMRFLASVLFTHRSGYENTASHRSQELRVVLEVRISSLPEHVFLIISIGPDPQMLRVDAQRNVALVADAHAGRNLAEVHEPGSSVSWYGRQVLIVRFVEENSPVAFNYSADPEPAVSIRPMSRVLVHVFPKAFYEWLARTFWRHVFLRRSSESGRPRHTARNAAFGSYPSRGRLELYGK